MAERIGIVAGSGQFPRLVAEEIHKQGDEAYVCGFSGMTDENLRDLATDFSSVNMGQLGKLIDFFKERNVQRVCMAGAVKKPKLTDFRPDWRAAKLYMRLRSHGDDAILRGIMDEFRADGLTVMQAAELVPGLRAPSGLLTKRAPNDDDWLAIRFGWPIGKTLGQYDIGQCLVLRKAMVVAMEGVEGTDATLERGGEYGGTRCVVLKMVKPGQDLRFDLPSIGYTTIELLVKHQYSCLAYEAGNTLFFDRAKSIELANKHKISVIGLTGEETELLEI